MCKIKLCRYLWLDLGKPVLRQLGGLTQKTQLVILRKLPWVFRSGRSVLPPGGLCAGRPACTESRWAGRRWRSTCWPSPRRAPDTGAPGGASRAWARWAGGPWRASCWGASPGGTPRSTTPRTSRTSWRRPAAGPARRTGTAPAREASPGWTWRRWRGPAPGGCCSPRRGSWARCEGPAAAEAERVRKTRPSGLCRWCSARWRFSWVLLVRAQDSGKWHIYRWGTGRRRYSERTRWWRSGRRGCGGRSRSTDCGRRGAVEGLRRAPGRLGRSALIPECPSCLEEARRDRAQRQRNPEEPLSCLKATNGEIGGGGQRGGKEQHRDLLLNGAKRLTFRRIL